MRFIIVFKNILERIIKIFFIWYVCRIKYELQSLLFSLSRFGIYITMFLEVLATLMKVKFFKVMRIMQLQVTE